MIDRFVWGWILGIIVVTTLSLVFGDKGGEPCLIEIHEAYTTNQAEGVVELRGQLLVCKSGTKHD